MVKRILIGAAKETARSAMGFALFILIFHAIEYIEARK